MADITHIGDLTPDPANARKHNPRNVGMIEDALGEVGAARSIVIDEDGVILAGNATVEAAAQAGIEKVQTMYADGETLIAVVRTGLTNEQKKRLAFLDNRSAELATWDADQLLADLDAGFDFDGLFYEDELAELLADVRQPEPADDPGAQVDRAAELQEVWQVERGQVWEVPSATVEGKSHRVMCGDSTSADDVAVLMSGAVAEMMFTDPPYGVDYRGGHFHSGDVNIVRERAPLEGDKVNIYAEFLPLVPQFVDGPCYVWFADSRGIDVYSALQGGFEIHALVIWHKINAKYAAMNAQYKQRHEPCIYFKPKKSTLRWIGSSDESTLWEIKRDAQNDKHPTQKPVELAHRAIGNHRVATVLDLFLGSGTTLIACEQTGRVGYGMEIEPRYVSVTLQRLADMGLGPQQVE
jgi:DNA modification methylase